MSTSRHTMQVEAWLVQRHSKSMREQLCRTLHSSWFSQRQRNIKCKCASPIEFNNKKLPPSEGGREVSNHSYTGGARGITGCTAAAVIPTVPCISRVCVARQCSRPLSSINRIRLVACAHFYVWSGSFGDRCPKTNFHVAPDSTVWGSEGWPLHLCCNSRKQIIDNNRVRLTASHELFHVHRTVRRGCSSFRLSVPRPVAGRKGR